MPGYFFIYIGIITAKRNGEQMMADKNKAHSDIDAFFDKEQTVASMTECTGLTQVPPFDLEEVESFTDIYDIPLASNKKGAKNINRNRNQ